MELEDLVGLHVLDAVDFINNGSLCDASVCRFRLDGVVYVAEEDPDDGYRSHLKDITIGKEITNQFPSVSVLARKSEAYGEDVLELINAKSGNCILSVGTKNADDYYPYFVADFRPQAISEGE